MSTKTSNQSVKLTQDVVDQAALPDCGQRFVRDTELKGFALRITAGGTKSFIVETRIEGTVKRLTLGRCPALTVRQARKLALKALGDVGAGINIIAKRERDRIETTTLGEAFTAFLKHRTLKPKTRYDYERLMAVAFADWQRRPLPKIRRADVVKRHTTLGGERGEAYANLAMRMLRAVLNFAINHYEDGFGRPLITDNPVARLNQTRTWFRPRRRQTTVRLHELRAWHAGVEALRGDPAPAAETVADYLMFLLYTGLRRSEAALLTWERVDLDGATVHLPDPKNHEPFTLPLARSVVTLLERRRTYAPNAFVFPGNGPKGYLIEPKRQIAKVIEVSGVQFTLHDLRRTFATAANALQISPYTLKRLMNHKISRDVTDGYIVNDVEALRGPVERIAGDLERQMGLAPADNVVAFPR